MTVLKDLTGQRFGRLVVLRRAPSLTVAGTKVTRWLCQCDCGGEKTARRNNLVSGNTKSCGCVWAEHMSTGMSQIGLQQRTHGHAKSDLGGRPTRTYGSWMAMRRRCRDPKVVGYRNYGGRGIVVCAEWQDSFETFLRDMGERPPGMTLDRKDGSKGYTKENCRWATPKTQSLNTRHTWGFMDIDGAPLSSRDMASHLAIDRVTLRNLLRKAGVINATR